MAGFGSDNHRDIHGWGHGYGQPPPSAASTSWDSHYDTASSSSPYGLGGTSWSASEERTWTPVSTVYSYHRRSDPDLPGQPRGRHYARARGSPIQSGSDFTDIHSIWATDIKEPARPMSPGHIVSRCSSPLMSGALPSMLEREPRFNRQFMEHIRVEQPHRSRSSAGRRRSFHFDSRPRLDHHEQDHNCCHHDQGRRPTRTFVMRVEEQSPYRDARGRRCCYHCNHGKDNLAMKFVKYAAGMPWPRS